MLRNGHRVGGLACALVALTLLRTPAAAGSLRYTLQVPDGQSATYSLDLDVRHAGTLVVEARWEGSRALSLKLEPPEARWSSLRRSGPPPQRLETHVDATEIGTWRLQIHALAARGPADGTLVIDLPEPPKPSPAPPPSATDAAPAPVAEPWMEPYVPPRDVPVQWVAFLKATERFRQRIAAADAPKDTCRWQSELMRYFAEQRGRLQGYELPEAATVTVLEAVAEAIAAVDDLRTSSDPLLAGPPPRDARLHDAWLRVRSTRLQALEDRLDDLLSLVQRGHAPELSAEDWPIRMISCLTACERFFDQRVLVGERRALNRELARDQWSQLLAAADALEALSGLGPSHSARGGR